MGTGIWTFCRKDNLDYFGTLEFCGFCSNGEIIKIGMGICKRGKERYNIHYDYSLL